jgi:dienelactone hydrolase
VPFTTRTVAYADQDTPLTGELYWDTDSVPRPGILLIHGGGGLDDHARGQASRYAALGYVVFACDMLGDGVAGDRERVIGSLTAMRDDPGLLAGRARAGLAELAGCGLAREPFAAVGFCFGGLAALTLARSGAELAAAVSIHGSLVTPCPAEPGAVKARVLACHGALDPPSPPPGLSSPKRSPDPAAPQQPVNHVDAYHPVPCPAPGPATLRSRSAHPSGSSRRPGSR